MVKNPQQGESYVIVRDISSHSYAMGEVVYMTRAEDGYYRAEGWVKGFGKTMERWVQPEDLGHLVTEEDIQAAIESIQKVGRT